MATKTITRAQSGKPRFPSKSKPAKSVTPAHVSKCVQKIMGPINDPFIRPKILTAEEYNVLRERGHYITKEEREAAIIAAEHEKERLIRESMARKEEIQRMDLKKAREQDSRLADIEEEARQRTMHLLERASNMKLEQEEEIQMCNRVILETKCRAIRDAQVTEKKLLERELSLEEKRQNDVLEQKRQHDIKMEEQKQRQARETRLHFARILKDQIDVNEEQRIMEFERKQEESRLNNLSNIAWQQSELSKQKLKEESNAKTRKELEKCNAQLRHFRDMEEEENKIMELRIQQFQKEKAERQAKIAEEQRQAYIRKEREKQRVAAQAMQSKDLQEQIDALNAARIQEEVEREWRKKEKEEALKKIERLKILKQDRQNQIDGKKHYEALELERERRECEKIAKLQREAQCRENERREKKRLEALLHRSAILKQVNEKEKERITSRQKSFAEGLAIRTEAELRKKKLRDAMERKCQEMRDNNVAEVYINDVKRMIENVK